MPPTSVRPVRGSDQNVSDTKLCHDFSIRQKISSIFSFSIFLQKQGSLYIQKYVSSIRTGSFAVPENSTLSFSQISDPELLMLKMKLKKKKPKFPSETPNNLRLGGGAGSNRRALQESLPTSEMRKEVHGQRHGQLRRRSQQAFVIGEETLPG